MKTVIDDLFKIAELENANIKQLLHDAYMRGLRDGVEIAKEKAIEAIRQEK